MTHDILTTSNLPLAFAAIVGIADTLIDENLKEPAANLLAYVIAQPTASDATRHHAVDLFDLLEAEICPRVIWDARAFAQRASFDDVLMLLQGLRDER